MVTAYVNRLSRPFTYTTAIRSASIFAGLMSASSTAETPTTIPVSVRKYTPKNPDAPFPYTKADLTPTENGGDASFYRVPRIVTHIDNNAIATVRNYYAKELPTSGTILDFCSSWISHYPQNVEEAAAAGRGGKGEGGLTVLGMGMNKTELSQNPVLHAWCVQDLNEDPVIKLPATEADRQDVSPLLDAATCVVSIDYLTKPIELLTTLRELTKDGGRVHLVISNRCFPTKVVGRWLRIGEEERLDMVGDYLWYSGWRDIEVVTLVEGSWTKDPLWVVRGTNTTISR